MACNECDDYNTDEEKCAQDCGCDFEPDSACVRFSKKDLECLGLSKGSHLEDIIDAIDTKICGVQNGDDGLSAYQIAVSNGFTGTEGEWLLSLNGDDCNCEEVVLYQEDSFLSDEGETGSIGIWSNLVDISTVSTVAIAGSTYTVPTGGDGKYEVTYQGVLSYTLGSPSATKAGVSAEVLVNSIPVTNSRSASTVFGAKAPYSPVSLFQSNISLVAGDEISVGIAVSDRTEVGVANSKIQIKKLA